jgi:apolipoprotein D and lipocalin family protein
MNYSKLTMALGLIVLLIVVAKQSHASAAAPPLPTVTNVDLQRYMGTWYEIARFEQFFQKGCVGSTATYAIRPDGDVEVINRCINEEDGSKREATGRAWVVDPSTNARLKVSFFWPFRGDYWIIDLGREYEYVAIGAPNRKYLWILARQPVLDEAVYAAIVGRAARQGFAVENLVKRPYSASRKEP